VGFHARIVAIRRNAAKCQSGAGWGKFGLVGLGCRTRRLRPGRAGPPGPPTSPPRVRCKRIRQGIRILGRR
jgi:hypothetical protein